MCFSCSSNQETECFSLTSGLAQSHQYPCHFERQSSAIDSFTHRLSYLNLSPGMCSKRTSLPQPSAVDAHRPHSEKLYKPKRSLGRALESKEASRAAPQLSHRKSHITNPHRVIWISLANPSISSACAGENSDTIEKNGMRSHLIAGNISVCSTSASQPWTDRQKASQQPAEWDVHGEEEGAKALKLHKTPIFWGLQTEMLLSGRRRG